MSKTKKKQSRKQRAVKQRHTASDAVVHNATTSQEDQAQDKAAVTEFEAEQSINTTETAPIVDTEAETRPGALKFGAANLLRKLLSPYTLAAIVALVVVASVIDFKFVTHPKQSAAGSTLTSTGQSSMLQTLQPASSDAQSYGKHGLDVSSSPGNAGATDDSRYGLNSLQNASGAGDVHASAPAGAATSVADPQSTQYSGAQSTRGGL